MQVTDVNEKEYRLLNGKVTRREEQFGHSYFHNKYGWLVGSTTLLGQAIPKDEGLLNYFKHGDPYEMEERLEETSRQGTRVHQACELLMNGETVQADLLITEKEKKCVASFIEWFRAWNPTSVYTEQVVAYYLKRPTIDVKYAGTLDILCKLNGVWTVVDIKTGRQNKMSHGLQIVSYGEAVSQSLLDKDNNPIKVEKHIALYLGTAHKTNTKTKNSLGLQKSGIGWNTEESEYTFDDFMRVYDYFIFLNNGQYPEPPKVQVYPREFRLLTEIMEKPIEQSSSSEIVN